MLLSQTSILVLCIELLWSNVIEKNESFLAQFNGFIGTEKAIAELNATSTVHFMELFLSRAVTADQKKTKIYSFSFYKKDL